MNKKTNYARRPKRWSYRTRRGIFVIGLLCAFGAVGLFIMAA